MYLVCGVMVAIVDLCNENLKADQISQWCFDGSRIPNVMRKQKPIHLVCGVLMSVVASCNDILKVVDLSNEISKDYTLTVWSDDGSRRPTYTMESRLKS